MSGRAWWIHSWLVLPVLLAGPALALGQSQDQADSPRIVEMTAAGNDGILYLFVGTQGVDDQKPLQWLSYMDKPTGRVLPALGIGPQIGRIRQSAAVDDYVHVFFENGSHYRYSLSQADREIRLPEGAIPYALAGVSGARGDGFRLWALVGASTASTVDLAWEKHLRQHSTQPASGAAGLDELSILPDQPAVQSAPVPTGFYLVGYAGSQWRPGFPAPGHLTRFESAWLCVSGDIHYLLWRQREDDDEIHFAWYDEGWTMGPSLKLPDLPVFCSVFMINKRVVFSSLIESPGQAGHLLCCSWSWVPGTAGEGPGKWDRSGPSMNQGEELLLVSPAVVGAFADQLAVVHLEGGKAEVGLWSTEGGEPIQGFMPVPERHADQVSASRRRVGEFWVMLVLGAVVFLVFWRRQEALSRPLALPAGLFVMGPGKRVAAALLDMVPAALLVAWLYYEPLRTFSLDLQGARKEDLQAVPLPTEVLWAWVWFALLYTVYCLLFELLFNVTPGKRLFGCRVWSETLTKPAAWQIIVRNLVRLVELEPHLWIWPFVLVVFVTVNRQRLGDLLARTIVVEGEPAEPESGDQIAQEDESEDQDDDGVS